MKKNAGISSPRKMNDCQSIWEIHHHASGTMSVAGMVHEIRNPLTTIKAFLQMLLPELQTIGKLELAEMALAEIDRTNDLLTGYLSDIKAGLKEKRKTSMNQIAKKVAGLYAGDAILNRIAISIHTPAEDLFVQADENQLKQVMVNLMKNAVEAIKENKKIHGNINISVFEDNGYVKCSLIDNGGGIDERSLEQIFTPFYTTKEDGNGIGLVISKKIIEDHGGCMNVESANGTTNFTISLPAIF